jgi:hypothetical protein
MSMSHTTEAVQEARRVIAEDERASMKRQSERELRRLQMLGTVGFYLTQMAGGADKLSAALRKSIYDVASGCPAWTPDTRPVEDCLARLQEQLSEVKKRVQKFNED